ncbi:MAG: ATP-binding protein [Sterolibacterium sp.]
MTKSLFGKYFLLLLTLVCGILLISGGINRYFSHQHNKSMFSSMQHGKAVAVAAEIGYRMRQAGCTDEKGCAGVAVVNPGLVEDVVRAVHFGKQGIAYVVDRDGQLIFHPELGRGVAKPEASGLVQVKAALAGPLPEEEPALLAHNLSGVEVLTSYASIEPLGWKLFVEQPATEINPALNATLLRTGSLMLAGLVISALTAWWLARSLVNPIRMLQKGAQRIGAGDLDLRIEVRTGDEIESLAEQFNEMAGKLRESHADLERKVVERTREIEEKSRQLEMADKHKSEFLASMSHELRTPLNAIIGFSDVLLQKMFGDINAKQEEYLEDIHSSGQHLLSLINDILDLAKVESGRMELNIGAFDLHAAIDSALTLIRERAMNHGIVLSSTVEPELGVLHADERKLKQILLNLLSNAVKFTPAGGAIKVTASQLIGQVEIAVSDTGIGIAPADQSAVFEEFRQIGNDYKRKAEGTGLGLTLTRKFVELHGGTIRLESESGKGSIFTFTLPLAPPASMPSAAP